MFETNLFMRADADDYVNKYLAEYSLKTLKKILKKPEIDGFIIDKGLEVEICTTENNEIKYGKTYMIKHFNKSCGTCSIIKNETLTESIEFASDVINGTEIAFDDIATQLVIKKQ